MRQGIITGPVLGVFWVFIIATTVAVTLSFASGGVFRPSLIFSLLWGIAIGAVAIYQPTRMAWLGASVALLVASLVGFGPMVIGEGAPMIARLIGAALLGFCTAPTLWMILESCKPGELTRHEFEEAVIKFLTGFGCIVFTAVVLVPFYVMVMTSLKSQQALLLNPLDFSIELSRGWDLFRSYIELFRDYGFGMYLWTSFYVSVLTVLITLLFSVPGAYAVARLRFKGRSAFSRSILLIYMVPMIVLALP
ncbi:MAG: carbohydrate ABC transporter permease, partial [Pseudomonadota bacterium]